MSKSGIQVSEKVIEMFNKIAAADPDDLRQLFKITSVNPGQLSEFILSNYDTEDDEEVKEILAEITMIESELTKQSLNLKSESVNVELKKFLDAGVHFGHLTRKWNPKMDQYIFMEKNGIHIIDLHKTIYQLNEATKGLESVAKSGRKILFVATKKQAKEIVLNAATKLNMPYVIERWQGGMLTNFATIRKSLKKMYAMEKLMKQETFQNLAKRERLMISRAKDKLERVLGGISDLNRLPAALFIVDIKREHIAVSEARKLNIPVFGLVDTNSDPTLIDYPIPANDDAFKSIQLILNLVTASLEEALNERQKEKEIKSKGKVLEEMPDQKRMFHL